MNEPYICEQHRKIFDLVCQKRLKEALVLLEQFLSDSDSTFWDLHNQLGEIQTSYNYMLQYMRRNMADPDRKNLYRKLLTETMEIADHAKIQKLASTSAHYYYTPEARPTHTIRHALTELESYIEDIAIADLHNDKENLDKIRKRHEEMYQNLFLIVWTNHTWTSQDESEAHKLLQSLLVPTNDVCLFISAVTLSLMECFDLRKFLYLFEAYNHERPDINQRALVGMVFIIYLYAERVLLYPEINARFALLNEDERFKSELNRLYLQLLRSRETEKINKKMREEIIPEMLKNVKNLHHINFNMEESDEEKNDYNPDWQDTMERSGLGEKMREITDLQMEGADIYMGAFSALKNYPFFKNISNWFYPFDKQHSEVVKQIDFQENNLMIDIIFQSSFFCDSDKYSLCFTMANIPPAQRKAMINQMTAGQEPDELNKKRDEMMMEERTKQPEIASNQYLHNLYRFFKLYPRRYEFYDVFKKRIELHKCPILANILNKSEYLSQIADYYFHKGYPAEAAEIYTEIVETDGGNAEVFQKVGYCRQKEKKYTEAIESYLKADMLQSDNLWTNRHLATCYRITGSYEKALKYYQKVEEVQPEDGTLTFYLGSCYAGLERYDEALNYFYKLDLLESDCLKAWRAIGWCSFAIGKHEQAEKYYNKVLEKKPLMFDYLNAGHIAWGLKQTEKAIRLYAQAALLCEDKKIFWELFDKDKPVLVKQGIDENDIPLMMDLI
ncbi:hypothetical protein EZS27_024778 [termite gut metagenome]|uniref:Uncharacterized protein n=1 Tax=termite gut metagenome TaxID=433724 RepID=A0A5J4QY90_9ZZZZ